METPQRRNDLLHLYVVRGEGDTGSWYRTKWHHRGGPITSRHRGVRQMPPPCTVILFNCALFRYFGTTEFYNEIGFHRSWGESQARRVKSTAASRLARKERVFTGAYVITNQGIKAPKQDVVVEHFLTPFWDACPLLAQVADDTRSWESVALEMMKIKGFGGSGFMTKEILQDALHTKVFPTCVDRNTYCPIGPGAKRGLNRVMGFDKDAPFSHRAGLEILIALFEARKDFWPEKWVELELHDIQFQLCEFDKYERVKMGEGRPVRRRRTVRP
jgi:hypothetical protein